MIEIYEGRLGGGKTYYAVRRMMEYMASGGHVSSNIYLNWEKVCAYVLEKYSWQLVPEQYNFLDDEKITLFHRFTPSGTFEQPSLVVVDEAHIWLNSRDWSQQSRELLTFLTQSRHCFTDIIFISQAALNCDKQIMRLVQYIWRFRDMKKYRIAGIGVGWPLNQFLRVQFDQDGTTVLDSIFEWKDKRIYELYNSFVLYRKFPRLEGLKVKFDGKVKKKGKFMKIIIVVVLLGICMAIWAFFKFKSNSHTIWRKHSIEEFAADNKSQVSVQSSAIGEKPKKIPLVIYDHFRAIIDDEHGKVIHGDNENYVVGELCEIGKVMTVADNIIVVAGFDGVPHVVKPKKFLSSELSQIVPAVPEVNEASLSKVDVAPVVPPVPLSLAGMTGSIMAPGRQVSSTSMVFDVSGGVVSRK